MKNFIYILFLLIVSKETIAQQVKAFTFHGQVYELSLKDSLEKPAMGVPIEVWYEDQLLTSLESGPKGKYKISLMHYPNFRIKFGKAPYITKIIDVNARGFERSAEFGIVNLELDVTVFKEGNLMGLDFMNYTPFAMAHFNKKKGKMEWDFAYSEKMTKRLASILEANNYSLTKNEK